MNDHVKSIKISPILIIRQGLPKESTGGPLRIVSDLLNEYRKRKIFSHVGYLYASALLLDSDLDFKQEFRDSNEDTTRKKQWKKSLALLLNRTKLGISAQLWRDRYRLFRRWQGVSKMQPLAHSHDVIASGLVFPKISGPKITTHHGKGSILNDSLLNVYSSVPERFVKRVFNELERDGIIHSDIITFPSLAAKKLFEDDNPGLLKNKQIEIIYNGIDFSLYKNKNRSTLDNSAGEPFVILNVSALVIEKRFDVVIATVQELIRRSRNVKLIHIGKGYLESDCKRKVQEYGLSNVIEFLGLCEHSVVLDHLFNADIYFMPSERVVFDLITLEAMAAGLPCILSEDGGNLELVRDGINGILCPVGNVQIFANSIEAVIDKIQLYRKLSQNARNTISNHYKIENMIDKYIDLYRGLYSWKNFDEI